MKRILVIGGAGGVGLAVVDALVTRGDKVSATVLNATEAAIVRDRHAAVVVHDLDLGDPEAAYARLNAVLADERWDAVAICAATAPVGPIETMALGTFRKTLEVNVLSAIAIYQAALPVLRASQGRLVYVSSMSGRAALPFVGAYSCSKYALEGIGDVMRREAGPQGVKVILVEPGGIRTNMVDAQIASVQKALTTISSEEDARYGHLYRGFLKAVSDSRDTAASTPEQTAAVIIGALDADNPETRYVVGEDAKQLIALAGSLPDRDLDGVFAQMFAT